MEFRMKDMSSLSGIYPDEDRCMLHVNSALDSDNGDESPVAGKAKKVPAYSAPIRNISLAVLNDMAFHCFNQLVF